MTGPISQWRRTATVLAIIAAAAAAGYVATCAVFPAPVLPHQLSVPALRGVPVELAVNRLTTLGLRARVNDTVFDAFVPAGAVAWQSPAPETSLPQGAVVRLAVGSGPIQVQVPDVTDLDLDVATRILVAAGFRIARVDTVSEDADVGTVVATSPAAGSSTRPMQPMIVSVSRGAPTIHVPDVTGLALAAARERLAAADLRVGNVDQREDARSGVISQQPAAGQLISRHAAVNLVVSGTP